MRKRKAEAACCPSLHAHSHGFTLAELIAVMAIIGIFASIIIPSAAEYMRRTRFSQNQENAKAVFLAAESVLTYYRASGQWNSIREQIKAECDAGTNAANPGEGAFDESGGTARGMENRVKTLLLPGADNSGSGVADASVAAKLRSDMRMRVNDGSGLMKGAIAIEIDTESGHVYSAFYASSDKELAYGAIDNGTGSGATLSISGANRSFESRRESLIGHYDVGHNDAANAVEIADLNKDYISVQSCALVNGEMLTVDITSDSELNNADAAFKIEIFEAEGGNPKVDNPLYELTVEPGRIGWSADEISVKTTCASVADQDIVFPIYREGANIKLVLDAISSPALIAAASNKDFSITRLQQPGATDSFDKGGYYNKPIICRVTPIAKAGGKTGGLAKWTNASAVMSGDGGSDYRISNFRHFYNARYIMAKTTSAVTFTVVNSLNWNEARMFNGGDAPVKGESVSFPVFSKLSNASFAGDTAKDIRIKNLKIDNASFKPDFSDAYAGLFCNMDSVTDASGKNKPDIARFSNISFDNAVMDIKFHTAPFIGKSLQGMGLLFGINYGTVSGVKVNDMSVTLASVDSVIAGTGGATDYDAASLFSFGGLAGENEGVISGCGASGEATLDNTSKIANAGGIAGKNLGTVTDASFGNKDGMHFKAESGSCKLCEINSVIDDALHFNKSNFKDFNLRKEQYAVRQGNEGALEYWQDGNGVYVPAQRISAIKIGNGNAGGIAGLNSGNGSINATAEAGGDPTGSLCNYGLIYANQGCVGGIAGRSNGISAIKNAKNYGTAAGVVNASIEWVRFYAGGIVGYTVSSNNDYATGCDNYGLVQAVAMNNKDSWDAAVAGGIIGWTEGVNGISGGSNSGTVLAYGKHANAGGWAGRASCKSPSNIFNGFTNYGFVSASSKAGGVIALSQGISMPDDTPRDTYRAYGNVESGGDAGGIVGYADGGSVKGTMFGGSVEGGDFGSAGGIVGHMYLGNAEGTMSGGSVEGGERCYAGGIVGWFDSDDNSKSVEGTMSGGSVAISERGYVGGIVGLMNRGTVGGTMSGGSVACGDIKNGYPGYAGSIVGYAVEGGSVKGTISGITVVKAGTGSYAGGIVGRADKNCEINFTGSGVTLDNASGGTVATAIGYGDTFKISISGFAPVSDKNVKFIGSLHTGEGWFPAYYADVGGVAGVYVVGDSDAALSAWKNNTVTLSSAGGLVLFDDGGSGECKQEPHGAGNPKNYKTSAVIGYKVSGDYNFDYSAAVTSNIGRRYITSIDAACGGHKAVGLE